MGIALPKELADVAAKVGAKWPQADETAMHTAAQAWRDAAAKITTLAKDADTTAGEALSAMTGGAADAAKKYWDKFVHAENGHFTAAVKGCLDAADRLEKAADSIGAAKVQITAKLKAAAEHTNLSSTVGSVSQAADPTVLSGATADINGILGTLTDAVNLKGQSVLVTDKPGSTADGPQSAGMPKGGLLGLASGLPQIDDLLPKPGADGTQPPGTQPTADKNAVWDPKLGQFVDKTTHQVVDPVLGDNSADVTGPVPKHVITAAGAVPQQILHDPDPPTGPIPVQSGPQHTGAGGPGGSGGPGLGGSGGGYSSNGSGGSGGGYSGGGGHPAPVYSDPSPPTGPIHLPPEVHVQQGTAVQGAAAPVFSPPPIAAAPMPSPVEVAGGNQSSAPSQQGTYWGGSTDAPAQPGAAVAGGAVTGGAVQGGQAPRIQPGMPAPAPGVSQGGVVQVGPGQQQPGVAAQPGASQVVAGGAQQGRPVSADAGVMPDQQSKQAPAPAPVPDKPSAVLGRHAKPVLRPEDTPALFLAYMFPIGHMPVPTSRPARQLPVPPEELDFAAGLRFPPHDHPDSALIDDLEAAGAVGRVELPEPRSAEDEVVVALAEEHDALGGEHERDWDRRFLVREAAEGANTEYSWPPGELFPEGGCAEGEAVILDHGTLIDRFGSAEGRVFAPDATPFPERSLPPEHLESGYQRYRVTGRLPVWQTISAPWFGQPGGGVRYRAVYPAADLIALGYLEVVHDPIVRAGRSPA